MRKEDGKEFILVSFHEMMMEFLRYWGMQRNVTITEDEAHQIRMTYEGPLYMLLNYGYYEPDLRAIPEETWRFIFDNTDLIADYIYEKYEILKPGDILEQEWEDMFENPALSYWDPLVFDTWEEYLDLIGGDGEVCGSAIERFDTYEEYWEMREKGFERYVYENVFRARRRWKEMEKEAEEYFRHECPDATTQPYEENFLALRFYVREMFDDIFKFFGLWYEYENDCSMVIHRMEDEK
ncbi:MAG: hypothetical protein J5636_05490 [Clostridiales bacterium]|nr:hypothetical protein [Clostridiales bacterium]